MIFLPHLCGRKIITLPHTLFFCVHCQLGQQNFRHHLKVTKKVVASQLLLPKLCEFLTQKTQVSIISVFPFSRFISRSCKLMGSNPLLPVFTKKVKSIHVLTDNSFFFSFLVRKKRPFLKRLFLYLNNVFQ